MVGPVNAGTTADRLRALAAAATPGPWTAHAGPRGEGAAAFGVWVIFASGSGYPGARLEGRRAEADAALIAALSPERVLALADLVEAAGAVVDVRTRLLADVLMGQSQSHPEELGISTKPLSDALTRVKEAFDG